MRCAPCHSHRNGSNGHLGRGPCTQYVERLRRLLNSRRPGGTVLQDAPRAQQIAITAWLTTLQRFRAYQVYSQLGSWERQEHFFAVVGRVSLARVPLELVRVFSPPLLGADISASQTDRPAADAR